MLIKEQAPFDFRENHINEIIQTIEDENFVKECRSKGGEKGFTRNRLLPFKHLITLLTQGISRSIQRELNSFYQKIKDTEFSIQQVSKSAFSHSRRKLKPEAFVKLNQVGIKSFYAHAPYLKYQGFRVLGIDGSTLLLPNHSSVAKEFPAVKFGPKADKPRCVARVSLLYDVLNLTTLDAQMDSYEASEQQLARQHLPAVQPGQDLLLFDRGYPSLRLMYELQAQGIDYCIRMRSNWWKEVRKMVVEGEKDKIVTFVLPAKDKDLLTTYATATTEITCRLVMVELADGTVEILCTSVTDRLRLPYECFGPLYHFRWNIEEGFKLYKCRVQWEAFSGKTAHAVKQDFFAKVFMMTTMAVLASPVEEKLKQEQSKSTRKHGYKINRTTALAMLREIAAKVFINKLIRPAINAFDKVVKATVEIVRPDRKYPRKKLKKKPPSMNYKQL